jgi:hypothetical protein
MTLHELKTLLKAHPSKQLRMILPAGADVPVSFHVTEVGRIRKTFIDCGGTLRESTACQLQVWVGGDDDHRLESHKAAGILDKAAAFLTDDSVPVEIEYEDSLISQYTIEGHQTDGAAVVLMLGAKHTDCLAKELCGVPVPPTAAADSKRSPCCSAKGGCC